MTNAEFINKYGRYEFNALCKYLPQQLSYAKLCGSIGNFKINRKGRFVWFYVDKNKKGVGLEYAKIFSIGIDNIKQYIKKEVKNVG